MTLIEVLLAIGVLGVLALIFNTLMVSIQREYLTVSERINLETEAADLAFYLKHYLSPGVEIREMGAQSVGSLPFSNLQGQIKEYDLTDVWTPSVGAGVSEPLAIFFRETLRSSQALVPDAGRYLPTGLFFVRPTVDRYGVLGFNLGSAGTASLTGASDQIALRFGKIVDLKFSDFVIDASRGDRKVQSFVVTFSVRAYKGGANQGQKWCPPDQMLTVPECQTEAAYFDVTKSVNILLRNNGLGLSSTRRRQMVSGGQTVFEPAVRRVVDGVYFLIPEFPLESLRR